MKWKLVSHPSSAISLFNLLEQNMVKGSLRYNPSQQSARISCRGEQRLFFIEQTGFNEDRFLFRNEYGFVIGKLFIENVNAGGGTIELEEKRFHYRLYTDPVPELVIFRYDMVQPLLTCHFTTGAAGNNTILIENKKTVHKYASLLLCLSWYIFNTPATELNTAPMKDLSIV